MTREWVEKFIGRLGESKIYFPTKEVGGRDDPAKYKKFCGPSGLFKMKLFEIFLKFEVPLKLKFPAWQLDTHILVYIYLYIYIYI